MVKLYAFLTGPAVWLTFVIFFGGLCVRVAFLTGLSRERDRVFYNHMSSRWGWRSIVHWLIPWGSVSMRNQPLFTFVFFLFHISLFVVPLFLYAHNMLLEEGTGVSLPSLPDAWADIFTMVFMAAVVFLFVRRIVRPEVRILTTAWDYTLLILTLLPFLTGFLAYHQWGDYQTMLILHILAAEIFLVIIPFSKLAHIILFFFSRAFIGFEMGGRRGARSW